METCITFVFFSAFYFQSKGESSALEFMIITAIFLSQFLIMMMTISKAIKDFVLKYKNKNSKIAGPNCTVLTEKAINKGLFDQSRNSEIMHTKTPVLKTIEEDPEVGFYHSKKMPVEEKKGNELSPMRYISEFEEMGEEKNLSDRIKTIQDKVFNKTNMVKTGKKSKLSKLLKNMQKKKMAQKKATDGSPTNKNGIQSQMTKGMTSKVSGTNGLSHSAKSVSSNSSRENKVLPPPGQLDKVNVFEPTEGDEDLRASKISLFSHNLPADKGNKLNDKEVDISPKPNEEEQLEYGSDEVNMSNGSNNSKNNQMSSDNSNKSGEESPQKINPKSSSSSYGNGGSSYHQHYL